PFPRIEETRNQARQRALAGTGLADEGQRWARGHVERNIAQHRLTRFVAKGDTLKPNITPNRRARHSVRADVAASGGQRTARPTGRDIFCRGDAGSTEAW